MFYGGSMEAIEYEKRNTVNKRMKNGVLGYTLGLIGSILSGMTAFFMGIFIRTLIVTLLFCGGYFL